MFAGRDGAVWRISVRPTDGPRLAAAIAPAEVAFDWSGGLVWVLAPEDFDLRAAMAGIAGHATLVRASGEAQARWGTLHPEPAPVARAVGRAARDVRPAGRVRRRRDGRRVILVFGVLPLLVFLALALLPRGRAAAIGIAVAAAAGLGAWVATDDGEIGEYYRILLSMAFVGLGMAVLAQAVRLALPADGPRWAYALVVCGVIGLAIIGSRVALGA